MSFFTKYLLSVICAKQTTFQLRDIHLHYGVRSPVQLNNRIGCAGRRGFVAEMCQILCPIFLAISSRVYGSRLRVILFVK